MDREHHADRAQRGWPVESPLSYAQWEAWLNTRLAGGRAGWHRVDRASAVLTGSTSPALERRLRRAPESASSLAHDLRHRGRTAGAGDRRPGLGLPARGGPARQPSRRGRRAGAGPRGRRPPVRPGARSALPRAPGETGATATTSTSPCIAAIADRVWLERLFLHELATLYAARVGGSAPPPAPGDPVRGLRGAAARVGRVGRGGSAGSMRGGGVWAGPADARAVRRSALARRYAASRERGTGLPSAPASPQHSRSRPRGRGTQLFAALLAGFAALLHRYTREDDLVVGTLADGRATPDLHGLLGAFEQPARAAPRSRRRSVLPSGCSIGHVTSSTTRLRTATSPSRVSSRRIQSVSDRAAPPAVR